MTETDRKTVHEAREGWRLAELAYRDRLDRYVSLGWTAEGPPVRPDEGVDGDGFRELIGLRQKADAALREHQSSARPCGT